MRYITLIKEILNIKADLRRKEAARMLEFYWKQLWDISGYLISYANSQCITTLIRTLSYFPKYSYSVIPFRKKWRCHILRIRIFEHKVLRVNDDSETDIELHVTNVWVSCWKTVRISNLFFFIRVSKDKITADEPREAGHPYLTSGNQSGLMRMWDI